ncbi:MAG: carboxypeptidase-like regulatory domain-containing protein, partial [Bacteroidaceae bacterium]|nr:carboxypeptidase-like regulatory domain-containing protein [Bacteroidaceae bacterium]
MEQHKMQFVGESDTLLRWMGGSSRPRRRESCVRRGATSSFDYKKRQYSVWICDFLCTFAAVMKKKIVSIVLAAMIGQAALYGQKTVTVSGYVPDAESSEPLISATVLDRLSGLGAVTNAYGFYSLTLPEGDVELVTRYLGYRGRVDAFR